MPGLPGSFSLLSEVVHKIIWAVERSVTLVLHSPFPSSSYRSCLFSLFPPPLLKELIWQTPHSFGIFFPPSGKVHLITRVPSFICATRQYARSVYALYLAFPLCRILKRDRKVSSVGALYFYYGAGRSASEEVNGTSSPQKNKTHKLLHRTPLFPPPHPKPDRSFDISVPLARHVFFLILFFHDASPFFFLLLYKSLFLWFSSLIFFFLSLLTSSISVSHCSFNVPSAWDAFFPLSPVDINDSTDFYVPFSPHIQLNASCHSLQCFPCPKSILI